MRRRMIQIHQERCTGCGLCVKACHEGAIELVNGKAFLVRENTCDGLGDCLPQCPANAIEFITKDTVPFTEPHPAAASSLFWPIQLKLAPLVHEAYQQADILFAADCTAFRYAGFHERIMRNKITWIACPKLDQVDYSEKLTDLLALNSFHSITLVIMDVPCCSRLEKMLLQALQNSHTKVPAQKIILSRDGQWLSTLSLEE